MGKATIVSGGTDGKYTIKLDYGKAVRDASMTKITARLAELTTAIASVQTELDAQKAKEDAQKIAAEAAIDDYVATTQSMATAFAAVNSASQAYQYALSSPTATPLEKAAAKDALTAAEANYKQAQEGIKEALDAQADAAKKLIEEKRKTAPLQLKLDILQSEKTQLDKDKSHQAGLKLEETKEVWCADFSEDAAGIVEIMEIPGEDLKVLIGPQADDRKLTNVGTLVAREVQTPAQVFFNAAILPGWQKFKPMYRRGVVLKVDKEGDTVDVRFDDDRSSAQKLDINRYKQLEAIPVKYMACNAGVFEVDDHCVIKFTDQNWSFPVVVGFVDNPKPCGFRVLSGAVRDGVIQSLGGMPYLYDYLPTQDAMEAVLIKRFPDYPSGFSPSKALAVVASPEVSSAGGQKSQYQVIKPTMYSGRMAKVVQVLMGAGENVNSPGFAVPYDYRWSCTHGVCQAADGQLWLVEISAENGVRIMRLPVFAGSPKCNATEAAKALFKGVPSGKTFPTGDKLAQDLAEKAVIQLQEAAALAPFYSKSGHSTASGWAFSDAGTEAHNTCWHDAPMGEGMADCKWSSHYKIDIEISGLIVPPPPIPPAEAVPPYIQATATLALVDVGRVIIPPEIGPTMMLYEPVASGMVAARGTVPMRSGYSDNTYKDYPCDATIHVFYAGDELKRVKYKWMPGSYPFESFGAYFPFPFFPGSEQLSHRYNGRRLPVVSIEGDNSDYPDQLGAVLTVRSVSFGPVVINLGDEPPAKTVYFSRYYGKLATQVQDHYDFTAFFTGFSTVKGDRNGCAMMQYRKTARETKGDIRYTVQSANDPRQIGLVSDGGNPVTNYSFEFFPVNPSADQTLPFGASWSLPGGFSVGPNGEGDPGDQYVAQPKTFAYWPDVVPEPVIDPSGWPDGREVASEVIYTSAGIASVENYTGEDALNKSDQWFAMWSAAHQNGSIAQVAFAGTHSVLGGAQSVGNKTISGDAEHSGDLLSGEPTPATADYTFIGLT